MYYRFCCYSTLVLLGLLLLLSSTLATRAINRILPSESPGLNSASESFQSTSLNSDRTLKIAYGVSSPSRISRFPYSALIAFKESSSSGRIGICGGTMIHPQWLLTAATCIGVNRQLFVSIGEAKLNPEELINHKDADIVQEHFVHPSIETNPTNGVDLGLLYLKTPQESPVPRLPVDESSLAFGLKLVGLGRGITDINAYFSNSLRVASSFIYLELETCMQQWNRTKDASKDDNVDSYRHVICVGGLVFDGSQGICLGDEGGPLLQVEPESYDLEEANRIVKGDPANDVLYGVAAFGPEDCGAESISLYTRIHPHLDWINHTIANYTPDVSTRSNNSAVFENKEETEDADWRFFACISAPCLVFAALIAGILCHKTSAFSVLARKGSNGAQSTVVCTAISHHPLPRSATVQISPFLASTIHQSTTDLSRSSSFSQSTLVSDTLSSNISVELLGKRIGSGAFGHVEEGVYVDEEGTRLQVAVKSNNLESEDSKTALMNEMRVFERVGLHPNIVRCYGGKLHSSLDDPTGYYLIEERMEWDLGKFYKSQRQELTFKQFLEIFHGIAKGLEHLHNCDVIHFDLKPSNILLDGNYVPKLADFGCSKKRAHSYITAAARGTMAYMAPELWLLGMYVKKAQVRAEKLDVFSYGVVMWETLTGQSPVDPLNVQELLNTCNAQDPGSMILQDRSEIEMNDDFRTNRFPLVEDRCPVEVKELMWDCLSYFNDFRPDVSGIKQSIEKMFKAKWVDQKIVNYSIATQEEIS
eukprot:g6857.t1